MNQGEPMYGTFMLPEIYILTAANLEELADKLISSDEVLYIEYNLCYKALVKGYNKPKEEK